jgi:orotidine-5'-phosphate decarboxylase
MMIDDYNNGLLSSSSSSSPPNSSYQSRIINSSKEKQSPIILALDYYLENFNNNNKELFKKCKEIITATESQICAIKINFHLLLSLSNIQILELNYLAHQLNIQTIADIKLNDIGNTNIVTVNRLRKLGFDAVIVNPIIGITEMKALVNYAHSINFGIISLVYMSHPTSFEGYDLKIISSNTTNITNTTSNNNKNNNSDVNNIPSKDIIPLYHLLYSYARSSRSDGIVIGATKLDIIKEITKFKDRVSIYSPGLLTQGGLVDEATKVGTDYFIIGRHILSSSSPVNTIKLLIEQIKKIKNNNILH